MLVSFTVFNIILLVHFLLKSISLMYFKNQTGPVTELVALHSKLISDLKLLEGMIDTSLFQF